MERTQQEMTMKSISNRRQLKINLMISSNQHRFDIDFIVISHWKNTQLLI